MVVKENIRLSNENGRLMQTITEKSDYIVDLLSKRCDDRKELFDLMHKLNAKTAESKQLADELNQMKESAKAKQLADEQENAFCNNLIEF